MRAPGFTKLMHSIHCGHTCVNNACEPETNKQEYRLSSNSSIGNHRCALSLKIGTQRLTLQDGLESVEQRQCCFCGFDVLKTPAQTAYLKTDLQSLFFPYKPKGLTSCWNSIYATCRTAQYMSLQEDKIPSPCTPLHNLQSKIELCMNGGTGFAQAPCDCILLACRACWAPHHDFRSV